LGGVAFGIYLVIDADFDDIYNDGSGQGWQNRYNLANTENIVGICLIVVGSVIFEIVMADLLILLCRPEDPETMVNPRSSDIAAREFVGMVINLGESFTAAWNAFKHNAGASFMFAVMLFFVTMLLNFIPFVGGLFAMFVHLIGYCAFMLAYQRYLKGEELTFSGFFKFGFMMPDAVLAMLLASFASMLAMIPSVFFGIYLSLTFSMIVCVAMDPAFAHLSIIEIMLTSRKIFHYHAWKLFGFQILSSLVLLLGFLCLGLGVFAAIPVVMYAQADIYYSHRHNHSLNGGAAVPKETDALLPQGETSA